MSLFASYAVIALLQLLCIVISFFTPELLFRASGREQRWHVPVAAGFLVLTVLGLSWLHDTALKAAQPAPVQFAQDQKPAAQPPQKEAAAPEPETQQTDFSIATRFGTVPLPVGMAAPLDLSIANNGAMAVFGCDLSVLDAQGTEPAPQDSIRVEKLQTTAQATPGETAQCSWKITPRIPGTYVLQASAATAGASHSQQVRVLVEHNYRVDIDEAVWVFNSRSQSSAEILAQHLRDAGFHNAVAKGEWKTRSQEQYIFYRAEDKTHLTELFEEIGDAEVQPYYYDSPRVGSKVKEMFEQNPDMGFLVIIH